MYDDDMLRQQPYTTPGSMKFKGTVHTTSVVTGEARPTIGEGAF